MKFELKLWPELEHEIENNKYKRVGLTKFAVVQCPICLYSRVIPHYYNRYEYYCCGNKYIVARKHDGIIFKERIILLCMGHNKTTMSFFKV